LQKENNLAKLGFGAMRLPLTNENNPSSIDMNEFTQMVDYYLSQGFNYFDTSYAYHNEKSENALKEALVERYPRQSYRIADKIPTWLLTKEEDNDRLVNVMLDRLSIDYFDVLLIHNINESSIKNAKKAKSFEYIEKVKKEGKAIKVGISFHDKAQLLEEILEEYSHILDIVQLQLNYLDWEDYRVQSQKCYDLCEKYDIEVTVMEPIKGGTLVNIADSVRQQFIQYDKSKSLASWALRFAASHKNVSIVLSGMNNLDEIKENCETFTNSEKLSQEDYNFLMDMADEIRKTVSISCSYCGYCVKECPMNIPIPDFFNLYNSDKIYSLNANYALYSATASSNNPASSCIKCEKCMENCTQHLNISELLENVANHFER